MIRLTCASTTTRLMASKAAEENGVLNIAAQSRSVIFVLITIFIDAIGFGLIMPVLPQLLMRVGDIPLADAIGVGAWMGLAMAVASFVSAPVLGNLSDRFGRRPILLASLAGLAVDYLLLAIAHTLPLIFVGRVLSGVFGGSYSTAMAAIADITPVEARAKTFGFISAAFGVGFVLGPAIGGLLGEYGERAPFYVAAGMAGLNFCYGLLVFPETLLPNNRRSFSLARANPLGALRVMRAAPGMSGVAVVLLLWQVASLVYPMTWSFYTIAQFGWSPRLIGLSLAAVGIVIAISQIFITGPAVRKFGERDAATIGLVVAIAGFVTYALITDTWMAFAAMIFIMLQSLVQPSLMAMLSRRATPETQGETQGISAMAMGLGSIAGPLVLTAPMAYFTGPNAPVYFPGAAFVVAAGFGLAALAMLRRLPRVTPV
jgi:MFS transporter, DHA1 family, tetracycline resistance protein